jgi:hypothetical protein
MIIVARIRYDEKMKIYLIYVIIFVQEIIHPVLRKSK